jgi:hypothetical protein
MQTQANAARKFGAKIQRATQHIGDFPALFAIRDEARAFASLAESTATRAAFDALVRS